MFTRVNIPYEYVIQAKDHKGWATLCYWMWMRSKFQKKVFYNATSKSIARLIGISQGTANFHIKEMLEYGWIFRSGKHLVMHKMDSYPEGSLINLPIMPDKSSQVDHLRSSYLNNNVFAQERAIDRKKDAVQKAQVTLKKLAYLKMDTSDARKSLTSHETSLNDRITLSNYKIGSFFGLSKRSGSRLQVKWNKMSLMRSEAFYEHIDIDLANLPIDRNYFLFKDRGYMRRRANTIYPIVYTTHLLPHKTESKARV